MRKYHKCEDCAFFDEICTEQPCCGCVDNINFIKNEEYEEDESIESV